jgi:hypothetical protein
LFATGINNTSVVIDTDGKFAAALVDKGCKFATGGVDTSGVP